MANWSNHSPAFLVPKLMDTTEWVAVLCNKYRIIVRANKPPDA
jgi:hypothetical protein